MSILAGLVRRVDAEVIMLRISYTDTGEEQRWTLCGQLAGAWVEELRSCWQYARTVAPLAAAVLDLSQVTFIDEAGEELLSDMRCAGAKFVATGVDTKHLVHHLTMYGKKPLRRLIGGTRQIGGKDEQSI